MYEGGVDEVRAIPNEEHDRAETVTVLDVREAAERVAQLVAALNPDDVPYGESVEMWREFSLLGRLATAGATLLARRVDESRRWARAGHRNVDDFLSAEGGEPLSEARKQRRTSERLRDLPDTEDALRHGRLSRDQCDAISDAATTNPAAERGLLDDAHKKSFKDLKDQCGRAKAAGDKNPEATAERIRRERRFTTWAGPDGGQQMFGKGPTEEAAVLTAAMQPIVDRLYREHRGSPHQAERQAYMWDALIELARQATNPLDLTGNDSSVDSPDGPEARPKRAGRPRYLGILRMDLAALVRGRIEGDEVCEISGLGPVPVTRARELLGESSLRLVLTRGIDVQNVTYLGRGPNAAQKIALLWSQPLCQNIACGHTWLQQDHREPFAKVQNTRLVNSDMLCPHDHDLKTYENWALVAGTGRRPFVPPDHPQHPDNAGQGQEPPDASGSNAELFPDAPSRGDRIRDDNAPSPRTGPPRRHAQLADDPGDTSPCVVVAEKGILA